MPAKIASASIFGFDCRLVEVEVDILNGTSSITIVGLGDASVQESKERIRSAIKNSDAEYPRRKKTINLAPADLRKHGPLFDLPIALGLLIESNQIPRESLEKTLVIGELALSGKLRRIPGVLPIAAYAKNQGFSKIIIPAENQNEASVISGISIVPAPDLATLILHLRGEKPIPFYKTTLRHQPWHISGLWHFEDIRGHEYVKRALLIAAAGCHNVLLYGPPGSGKTLLAQSFQSILPPLSFEEAVEVTKIYSIAGKFPSGSSIIQTPPFRAIHHTASTVSLIGGGTIPRPGEISLAHKGVLFLDELLEFSRASLDSLRQPMEEGKINVTRAAGSSVFPAEFILIAATNPCPCGYFGDPVKPCRCTASQLQQYRKKLSGPLLDRIDIVCPVPRLPFEEITTLPGSESSHIVLKRVIRARQIQYERFAEKKEVAFVNAKMNAAATRDYCRLNEETMNLLKEAFVKLHCSGRAYYRILKVSRTIADLDGSADIMPHHLAEALQYRPRLELEKG